MTKKIEIVDGLFTIERAAEFLGLTRLTLRRMVHDREIDCHVYKKKYRFTKEQLAAFLHRNRVYSDHVFS